MIKPTNILLLLILIITFLIAVLMYTITIIVIIKLPDIIMLIQNTTRSLEMAVQLIQLGNE